MRYQEGASLWGLALGPEKTTSTQPQLPSTTGAEGSRSNYDLMKRVWSGQPVSEEVGPIGPPPAQVGGPELLIGGYTPTAIRRVGRWGDGFISGGVRDPEQVRQMFDVAEESWRAEGREGKPRLVACLYYALGPNAD